MTTAPLRCLYSDCPEGHPIATDDPESKPSVVWIPAGKYEPVTCPTCREYMGLPALVPGTLDYA